MDVYSIENHVNTTRMWANSIQSNAVNLETRIMELEKFQKRMEPFLKTMELINPLPEQTKNV